MRTSLGNPATPTAERAGKLLSKNFEYIALNLEKSSMFFKKQVVLITESKSE